MEAEVVVAIVLRQDGRVLMVRRKRPEGALHWSFPGGKINLQETENHASQREVEEEAGISCRPLRKIGQWTHPDTSKEIAYWLCRHSSGEARVCEPDKIDRVEWLTFDQFRDRVSSRIFPKIVREIKKNAAFSKSEKLGFDCRT
jgi:8-oxo-dGTP diphosphatase